MTSQRLASTPEAHSQTIPQGSVAALNFIDGILRVLVRTRTKRARIPGNCFLIGKCMIGAHWKGINVRVAEYQMRQGPDECGNTYFDRHLARRVGEQCSVRRKFPRKEAAIIARRFIRNPCHIQVCLICNFVHRTKEVS